MMSSLVEAMSKAGALLIVIALLPIIFVTLLSLVIGSILIFYIDLSVEMARDLAGVIKDKWSSR